MNLAQFPVVSALSIHRKIMWHLLQLGILVSLVGGCASYTINETGYDYFLAENIDSKKSLKVLIATHNFGVPSKSYLQRYEAGIDRIVAEQLEKQGHSVIANGEFESAWRRALRKYGSPFDASESQINQAAFRRVMSQVISDVGENTDADAIVFTDLIEQDVIFYGGNTRRAKWHGVSRAPRIKGGNQISADFDWSQTVPAASLRVIVYSRSGELLFKSIGGLEVTRQLDTQRTRFTRRSELFTSQSNVRQGVSIALHPFVPFEK